MAELPSTQQAFARALFAIEPVAYAVEPVARLHLHRLRQLNLVAKIVVDYPLVPGQPAPVGDEVQTGNHSSLCPARRWSRIKYHPAVSRKVRFHPAVCVAGTHNVIASK